MKTSLQLCWLLLLAASLVVPAARADQCAWNSKAEADAALRYLQPGVEYLSFCEPCGDSQATKGVVEHATVGVPAGGEQYFEVSINGEPVDLAYIFVKKDASGQFFNLGKLVGCGATGVSKSIGYPAAPLKSKLGPWYGRWKQGNGTTELVLKETTLHTGWVETTIFLISDEWGDQRGELTGYLHTDEDPPAFVTPFAKCHLLFELNVQGLAVRDNGKCGGLMRRVVGRYGKVSDVR
jgi:hypothetical protein